MWCLIFTLLEAWNEAHCGYRTWQRYCGIKLITLYLDLGQQRWVRKRGGARLKQCKWKYYLTCSLVLSVELSLFLLVLRWVCSLFYTFHFICCVFWQKCGDTIRITIHMSWFGRYPYIVPENIYQFLFKLRLKNDQELSKISVKL